MLPQRTRSMLSWLSYFRTPFPSTQGFSAYRMPGVAVHGPLLFVFTLTGFSLCWQHPFERLFMIVWVLAGLYLGRDIAVYCHYAPPLTLVCWAVCALVIHKAKSVAAFGTTHGFLSGMFSLAAALLLFLVALRMTRRQ
ncbi:MAG TPA: hypothetical protein VKT33_03415 [Candidatus Angelobacter sp.]|nr:hypothetical protein [Candidatus Angelobacter sp.]